MRKVINYMWMGLLCAAALSQSTLMAGELSIAKLSISGQSSLKKPADELHITLGVVTEGEDAEFALSSNNEKMQMVMRTLQKAGLERQEYETGRFSIRPVYSTRPKESKDNWQASIIGYEVSNSINIRTDKIKQAGTFIDAAGRSGANSITDVSFGLKDARIYREEAINMAAGNALADANMLARATGVRLVRVIDVSLDDENRGGPYYKQNRMMSVGDFTPIEAGDVEITARVSLVYEIAANNK